MTRKIKLGSHEIRLPQSASARIALGLLLVAGGFLWFLPILGLWMLPLGLLVLSHDIPAVRAWRRKLVVWWGRRRSAGLRRQAKEPGAPV